MLVKETHQIRQQPRKDGIYFDESEEKLTKSEEQKLQEYYAAVRLQ